MAPSAKHLPFRHKELGSFPIIRVKTIWECKLSFPEMEKGGSLGPAHQLTETSW